MPFYEYECQACKFYTEVMQKITDAPLTKCPSCGKRKLKKLLSAPVFRLKGAGWYETDFKGDKEAKRNLVGADKEEAKSDTKAPEAKEGKPEVKEAKESKEPKEPKESKESKDSKDSKDRKESRAPQRKLPRRKPKAPARKAGRKGRR
jgi:putative FmdB family regulatory protein